MLKKNWKETLSRYRAFWENKPIDRPPVMFDSIGSFSNPMYNGVGYDYCKYGEDIGHFRIDYERVWEQRSDCKDDTVPCIAPQMGGALEAAFFAGDIHWGSEVSSLIPHNPAGNLELFDVIKFEPDNKYFRRVLREVELLSLKADGKYGVNYDGSMSITSTISQLLGGTRFMFELVDNCEGIRKLAELITDTFIKLQNNVDKLIPRPDGGTCHRWLNYWNPGRGFWFSEDDAIMISPVMYRNIFLDLDMKLCSATDCAVLHWHDASLHLIDDLLKIKNLKMIQISHDPNGPGLDMVLDSCKKIVETGCKVCFQIEYDEDKIKRIFEAIPYEYCMFYLSHAKNVKQANSMLNKIERLAHARG